MSSVPVGVMLSDGSEGVFPPVPSAVSVSTVPLFSVLDSVVSVLPSVVLEPVDSEPFPVTEEPLSLSDVELLSDGSEVPVEELPEESEDDDVVVLDELLEDSDEEVLEESDVELLEASDEDVEELLDELLELESLEVDGDDTDTEDSAEGDPPVASLSSAHT